MVQSSFSAHVSAFTQRIRRDLIGQSSFSPLVVVWSLYIAFLDPEIGVGTSSNGSNFPMIGHHLVWQVWLAPLKRYK